MTRFSKTPKLFVCSWTWIRSESRSSFSVVNWISFSFFWKNYLNFTKLFLFEATATPRMRYLSNISYSWSRVSPQFWTIDAMHETNE